MWEKDTISTARTPPRTVADRFVYLRPALAENPAADAFGGWLVEEGARSPAPATLGLGASAA